MQKIKTLFNELSLRRDIRGLPSLMQKDSRQAHAVFDAAKARVKAHPELSQAFIAASFKAATVFSKTCYASTLTLVDTAARVALDAPGGMAFFLDRAFEALPAIAAQNDGAAPMILKKLLQAGRDDRALYASVFARADNVV